jgi:hypothetical protein
MLCAATLELEVAAVHLIAGLGRPDITIFWDSCGMRVVGRQPAMLRDDTK